MYAYVGKILRINLSNRKVSVEPTAKYGRDWLGASGIAVKLLYDELKPWVTPYDPANKLIISAGPLIGTTAPGANKMNVSSLSPVTGGWGSSCSDSYVGGQLKNCGYDVIIVEGKAHSPVYLWIHDDKVEIRDASHLWGKTTWESLEIIRQEYDDQTLHALSIGPAGENLVRAACIIQDRGRAFGRCGMGSVMGSKNLKLIVAKGTGSVKVAEPDRFMNAVSVARKMFEKAKCVDKMRKYGTMYVFYTKQENCGVPYKNFQECSLPDDVIEDFNPMKMIDKYEVAHQSFPGCAYGGCSRHIHITDGPYAGLQAECNQNEVFGTLLTRLAIRDTTFMVKANALCNQLGLDVDVAGGAIGWAMECYQRGIIDKNDTDGLELNWGDAGVALELIRKISFREGFGNILAEGNARAADIVGRNSSHYALHIKKQDLYELCRGSLAWSLGTTTSTRGGGHTTGAVGVRSKATSEEIEIAKSIFGVDNPDKALEYEGKAQMVYYMEMLTRVNNSFGVCHFNTAYWDINLMELPLLAELYSAATGWETTVDDLKKITMKQLNLEKAFNLRFTNFDRKDDMPTPRDLSEPIPTGKLAGWKMDEVKYNRMLDQYYEIHGWDKETSFPIRKTLSELDLDYVADELEEIGKLR